MRAVLDELVVESAILAEEMSAALHHDTCRLLEELPVRAVPHNEFKCLTGSARAVIPTGECTPYANVILIAGVSI